MLSDRSSGPALRVRLPLAAAVVALAVFAAHSIGQRLSARAALVEGEEAFSRGDFPRAAERFRAALEIDPSSTAVRLRLAAAYQSQYVPGGESTANHDVATRALEEIARVLERDGANRAAIIAAGEITDGRRDYDRARDWYRRLAAIDPSNPAALARTSALSLTQASGAVLDAEARAGLSFANGWPPDPGADAASANAALRAELSTRWAATIAEGIGDASKALTIDREHEGAMLTLEGWHQLAAGLAASPDEYRRHTTAANQWRRKALDLRRLKAERRPQ